MTDKPETKRVASSLKYRPAPASSPKAAFSKMLASRFPRNLYPGPARTFQENIQVARGFVKLQFYLRDLVETGGKESVRKVGGWVYDLFEELGVFKVVKKAEKQIEAETKRAGRREVEEKLSRFLDAKGKEIVQLLSDLLDVKSAYERGLGLQAIVISVSSFEEYVHQVTVEEVSRSVDVERRFRTELKDGLRYEHLSRAGGDPRGAIGEAVAESFSYSNSVGLLRHLQKLTGSQLVDDASEWCAALDRYQAYRHVAVHSAGLADPQFVATTAYRGELGKPVEITHEFAEQALTFFEKTVLAVEVQRSRQMPVAPTTAIDRPLPIPLLGAAPSRPGVGKAGGAPKPKSIRRRRG
ncbi:MAG: hypothetical protein L3K05_00015 [Thermoplasmata archaeon]|nr:hypothetical protein [Thermoplasmata archaeon]